MKQENQKVRATILIFNIIFLFIMSFIAFGELLPPSSEKAIWLYAGVIAAVIGNSLVTPFFVRPADTIPYSLAVIITLLSFSARDPSGYGNLLRIIVLLYTILILLFAFVGIFTNNNKKEELKQLSRSISKILGFIGSPNLLYVMVVIYCAYNYHNNSIRELFAILVSTRIGRIKALSS